MTLNEAIKNFKLGDSSAFQHIVSNVNGDINYIVRCFNIPGKNIDDLRSIAMEQILDCLTIRELKRGKGTKKVLDENDNEIKNKNIIKSAIKYRMIRELRATKCNIRVSYDIPILNEFGTNYLDRKGKPLYIGIIIKEDGAYLYEGCRNTKLKINVDKNDICRNNPTYDMKNPLDSSVSFDLTVDGEENEHEVKDFMQYNTCKKQYDESEKQKEINNLIDYVSKINTINDNIRSTIKDLLLCSNSIFALKDYVKNNKKQVNECKYHLLQILQAEPSLV